MLAGKRVCYKRCMRKWMRERMKRRKKGSAGSGEEKVAAPSPLQPKFYDTEPTPAAIEPEPAAEPEAKSMEEESPVSAAPPASSARPRPSRRRRGRGGRGKAASPAPAAAAAVTLPEVAPEPQEPAAPAAPPAPAAHKGTVILAIGLPGSGKSAWFKRHNIRPLSSDLLRELLFDDPKEQRFQDLVFSNLRSMLKARLVARRPLNYVDATNLTPHDRHSWIKLAKDYGYDVQGVFFDVPLEICLERNEKRSRSVEEDVMRRMAAKLKAPTFDEGFSKITVVRVKKKDNIDPEGALPVE